MPICICHTGGQLADFLALLDKPLVLLIVLTIGGVIGIMLESALNARDRERRRAYWRGRNAGRWPKGGKGAQPHRLIPPQRAALSTADRAADQLTIVSKAAFHLAQGRLPRGQF